ncbi:MAG: hypothetical protein M1817_002779 [Caeruleum heppii]|nr:MAG: hypothetical protein M1817_002779 [Caeruleum heppii]
MVSTPKATVRSNKVGALLGITWPILCPRKMLTVDLGFTATLGHRLQSDPRDASLVPDLEREIQGLRRLGSGETSKKCEQLDCQGTALWNLSTRLRRKGDVDVDMQVLCHVRVFAFLLLDSAQQSGKGTKSNCMRLLKVALKAAKYCLDQGELPLCLKVLEEAAKYEETASKFPHGSSPEDLSVYARLSTEYYIIRTTLAWRQSRLDLADHMFSKASLSDTKLGPGLAEALADLVYEIGRGLLAKKQFELAVKWLERSCSILTSQDLDSLSVEAGELRLSIMHSTVRALVATQTEAARAKARDLMVLLEDDFGDKLAVLLLKVDLIAKDPTSVPYDHFLVLQRMVGIAHLHDSNFKILMRQVHRLHEKSPKLACELLDKFLFTRLLKSERDEWVEKVFVTRLWFSTSPALALDGSQTSHPDDITPNKSCQKFFEAISARIQQPLTAAATHAGQMLIWKMIESYFSHQNYLACQEWCDLALHPVFAQSGDINMTKIARKKMLCALSRDDAATARDVFDQMLESGKSAAMTRYLMFRGAIQLDDVQLAGECLQHISTAESKTEHLLYACVLEAQKLGNRKLVLAALQRVLDTTEHGAPTELHIPALLRCAIHLMMTELGHVGPTEFERTSSEAATPVCKLYDAALKRATAWRCDENTAKQQPFAVVELEWFSRTSYNMALKSCTDWRAELVLQLLHLQHYLNLRQHANEFRRRFDERPDQVRGSALDDLLKKYAALLAFDFEAAARLKAWDDLNAIVEQCSTCGNMTLYGTLADIIMTSQAPISSMISPVFVLTAEAELLSDNHDPESKVPAKCTMSDAYSSAVKKIINTTFQLEETRLQTFSRWVRCLFQISVSAELSVAEQLLDQVDSVLNVARETDDTYPPEEIEWLATTAFNRAVDFYCASEDEGCRRWAEKALTLAGHQSDRSLHDLLQTKYLGLSWDG